MKDVNGDGEQGRPELRRASGWGRLWQPFWALPAALALGSLFLGLGLPRVDEAIGEAGWVFQGQAEGARSLLSTVAGAMISVTGLVFSITIVVLQLASSQYSPRVLANFLESRTSQVTLGVFTGSFIYALTVLRQVGGGDERVPQISVTVSYAYVLVAVGMFLAFIHHITVTIQVSAMMSQIRGQTVANIRRMFPDDGRHHVTWSPEPGSPRTELATHSRSGYVTVLDSTSLVDRAAELDAVVELSLAPGDFVVAGQTVGRVWGRRSLTEDETEAVLGTIHLGPTRTLHADVGLGVRQLLDIAERALSPGVNDPTTALQAMNEMHVVLRELGTRPDLSAFLVDDGGTVRAVYRPPTFARALAATVEEMIHYGRDSVRVVPHLRNVLTDLVEASLPEHRTVAEEALTSVERYLSEEHEPVIALDVRGKSPENP